MAHLIFHGEIHPQWTAKSPSQVYRPDLGYWRWPQGLSVAAVEGKISNT